MTIAPSRVEGHRRFLEKASKVGGVISARSASEYLAILDDYSALKAEVERLNTWHSTLSEAWKARAEKVERKLVYNENELENTKDRVRKMRAELALGNKAWLIKQKQLEEARAALALREEKK